MKINNLSVSKADIKGLYLYEQIIDYKKLDNLFAGISIGLKDTVGGKRYYGLEFGYSHTVINHTTFISYSYYASTELLTDFKHKVIVAPKIGANVSFSLAIFGSELAYYTDFKQNALYLTPYVGFGVGCYKGALKLNIPLYNKNAFNTTKVSFSITLPIVTTKETDFSKKAKKTLKY